MADSLAKLTQAVKEPLTSRWFGKALALLRADVVAVRALLTGSAVYDAASLADGAGVTSTITVTGAALGDYVIGLSCSVDLQGVLLTGYVSAANTVSFRLQNETTGAVDLASATYRAVVAPQAAYVASTAMNLTA